MSKKFIGSFVLVLLAGIFMASLVSGKDLKEEDKTSIYYDSGRDSVVEIIFYKKIAVLSGKSFGRDLRLKVASTTEENIFKNEKNNLVLKEGNEKVIIFIGDKKVFEGKLQKDNTPKNTLASTLTEKVWLWENLIIKNDDLSKPVDSESFNLSFSKDGKILATTNCANFEGIYILNKNNLTISNLTQTKNICSNKEGKRFTEALTEVNSIVSDDLGNLVLFLKNNSGSMSFSKK